MEDILEAISRIEEYTKGLAHDDFMGNRMVIDAVVRNIEIISEASKNIPPDVRQKCIAIP